MAENEQRRMALGPDGSALGDLLVRSDLRAYRHENGLRLEAWHWRPEFTYDGRLWAQARVPLGTPLDGTGPTVATSDVLVRWGLHLAKEGFPGLPW